MTNKSLKKSIENPANPLEKIEAFDPASATDLSAAASTQGSRPISPLGTAEYEAEIGISPVERLLSEANARMNELRSELAEEREQRRVLERRNYKLEAVAAQVEQLTSELQAERSTRLELEKKLAALESEIRLTHQQAAAYEEERARRLELERKVGSLEFKAQNVEKLAEELEEERKARIQFEREKATLAIQVEHGAKLEQLLAEERQSRANAQMRASTAEAKLAQIEGELAAQSQRGKGSFFGRGRGN